MSATTFTLDLPVARAESPDEAPLDLAALRDVGDEDLVVELGQLFIDSTRPLLSALREAMARADAPALARAAHSVKGASANMYAEALRRAAAELEQAAKRGELDGMLTLVAEVEHHFEVATDYLKGELRIPG